MRRILDESRPCPYHRPFCHRVAGVFALSIPSLLAPIAEDMRATDAVIRARLHSDVVLIRKIADYIIHSGGKRLRPALLLLSARACGYDTGTHHHELAATVEFIHTATLLHDDVVDESELRRGRQTANALFGNAASVLVGDFLYSRAFQMMVSVDDIRVMQILADATNIIAEGEVLQLLNCHDASLDREGYLRVVHYKTAKLFEAAARLGAVLGRQPAEVEEGLARFSMHLGTAFQIIDDVLDYCSDEARLGKHLGDDLAEGKTTLPLIFAMQRASAEDAACVRRAIEEGGRDEFAAVLDIIHRTGALDACRDAAREEVAQARDALAPLPASIFKDTLLELAAFAHSRDH